MATFLIFLETSETLKVSDKSSLSKTTVKALPYQFGCAYNASGHPFQFDVSRFFCSSPNPALGTYPPRSVTDIHQLYNVMILSTIETIKTEIVRRAERLYWCISHDHSVNDTTAVSFKLKLKIGTGNNRLSLTILREDIS